MFHLYLSISADKVEVRSQRLSKKSWYILLLVGLKKYFEKNAILARSNST